MLLAAGKVLVALLWLISSTPLECWDAWSYAGSVSTT